MRLIGIAIDYAQFFNNIAGIPSGPWAALDFISEMAVTISLLKKIIEKWETCFATPQNLFASHWCFSENLRCKTSFCSKFINCHK